ncbi:NAD-dependent epimerase/dehydratase family protein [Rhodococcus sp. IEGM 1408]|uniref:NAD-dependent epimerase/dehydratase family protein n=1 Tax=Rhodococcus sp. IEGM 1408 TaxID=3082220 RepID=UPI002953FF4A|nr:NAD-dependent epimerase/dehydratase family protein [Rhodococcus sp. IEGM 1408]MDV8000960.1 NAD-dependent epimerase/dehydratase family protein [Rhodococcus sp. IEGM 1408]
MVLTGASGDFGTALLRGLILRDEVDHVVALARSPLRVRHPKIAQHVIDLTTDDLDEAFAGADAVIHCAFMVEEPRDKESARVVNVDGSRRVLLAAESAGARVCVMTSSINAYGPRGGPEVIDETAAIGAGEEHYYFHHKALMEEDVRRWRQTADGRMAVAVLRPAYVVGPDMANSGLETMRSRVVLHPSPRRSYFQFLHQDDLVDAYLRVLLAGVDGEFNLGPEGAMTVSELCRMNRSVCIPVPLGPSRRLADLGFRLGLLPFSSHWVTRGEPVTTSQRLRDATGWQPRYDCADAARLMLAG